MSQQPVKPVDIIDGATADACLSHAKQSLDEYTDRLKDLQERMKRVKIRRKSADSGPSSVRPALASVH